MKVQPEHGFRKFLPLPCGAKGRKGKEGYGSECLSMSGKISVQFDIADSYDYVSYQCDIYRKRRYNSPQTTEDSFIKKIVLENNSAEMYEGLRIVFACDSDILSAEPVLIDSLPPEAKIKVTEHITVRMNAVKLYALTEALPCRIVAHLVGGTGEILAVCEHSFILTPINEAKSCAENCCNYACYITPNSRRVADIIRLAREELQKIRPMEPSFIGYDSNDIDYVRMEMMAIYNALKRCRIAYSMPPAYFEKAQKVRLADQVLEEGQGTCLDLTILYCSCLESVGLNPVMILLDDHAFAACFLREATFVGYTCKDVGAVFNGSAMGNMEMELVECTAFVESSLFSFTQATEAARNRITFYTGEFTAVDVVKCHHSVFRPIPELKRDENGNLYVDPFDSEGDAEFERKGTDADGVLFSSEKKEDKFSYWERKLLDLTLANKLINFRITRMSPQIAVPDPRAFLQMLCEKEKFRALPLSVELQDGEFLLEKQFKELEQFRVQDIYGITADAKTYKALIRKANAAAEETGANILYVTLGIIYYRPEKSQQTFCAPCFLIPVKGKLKGYNGTFEIEADIENLTVNTTVLEYFRQTQGLNFDDLYSLDAAALLRNFTAVFNAIRDKTSSACSISVDESKCFLAAFSFANHIMWEDMRRRSDVLRRNRIVSALASASPIEEEKPDAETECVMPLPADSSQIRAVADCARGRSFVLDGPPGTGKSQTIVNMISNAMYHGKTVLFVAAKMAALDVVKKRLDALGVGTFCLEMHSGKTKKQSVLSQLERALAAVQADAAPAAKRVPRLAEREEELDTLVAKMNSLKYPVSLRECIVRYSDLRAYDYDGAGECSASGLTQETVASIEEKIAELARVAEECGEYAENPFSSLPRRFMERQKRAELERKIAETQSLAESLWGRMEEFAEEYPLAAGKDARAAEELTEILRLLCEGDVSFAQIRRADTAGDARDRAALARGGRVAGYFRELESAFSPSLSEFDAEGAVRSLRASKNPFRRIAAAKTVARELARHSLSPKNPYLKIFRVRKFAERLQEKRTELDQVLQDCDRLREFFPEQFRTAVPDFAAAERRYENGERLRGLLGGSAERTAAAERFSGELSDPVFRNRAGKLLAACACLHKAVEEFRGEYKLDIDGADAENYWRGCCDKLGILRDYAPNLSDLPVFDGIFGELRSLGADGKLLELYKAGRIPSGGLVHFFRAGYYKSLIREYFQDPYYSSFNGLSFNAKLEKYMELVEKGYELSASRIVGKLRAEGNAAAAAGQEALYRLQRCIKNGGRRTTVRNIVAEFDALIRKITPCFLMSPLSAAQYLSAEGKKFDIVIFDEASQIPTAEAVGAISRGEALVVAGDPQQMPPTSFFKTMLQDDREIVPSYSDYDDLESLLDDCLALGMRRNRLLWHYRSCHESLIAFSNNSFYDHSLYTFPSPDNGISRVSMRYIGGAEYESGVNKAEGDAIAEEVIRRFKDPALCRKSIGIVTFNIKQNEYISQKIADFFDGNPQYAAIDESNADRLFVKNLENVQGDERDVILFSVCYGRDGQGRFRQNFGPLSLYRGERRLNVAVTRAREEMIVFSSIRASDIDVSRHKNRGASVLCDFLEYAERGTAFNLPESAKQTYAVPGIEKFLRDDLKELGYDCDIDVGDSRFKIDLCVKDGGGSYILGVICDSETYSRTEACIDRNYVQNKMLARLGWSILHVYTLDYFNNRARVLRTVLSALEKAEEGQRAAGGTAAPAAAESVQEKLPQALPGERRPAL